MTVEELLEKVSSKELSEWMTFFELEPFGTQYEDFRFGVVASIIANVNLDKKKRKKPFQPKDFFNSLRDEEEKYKIPTTHPDWEKQLTVVERLNKIFGGKDLRDVNNS